MAIEVMGSAAVNQDVIIDQVREKYNCRVLKCEGRPVLEYTSEQELDQITEYVRETFQKDLLDVFFTAIPGLQPDE
ncbi:hypothetical protein ABD76_02815 [Paenibacillus dendritiformis]|uniref:hypothetical protein n=1 Tax=Paenibacillus dendritiformis TaxID=130049 RepID=UPI0018CCAC65|nr:hypothetical protein [Paenibacillus dendritiformis]MBG9791513.1 hypothetical protein [Paenibacillus dendritiformis]